MGKKQVLVCCVSGSTLRSTRARFVLLIWESSSSVSFVFSLLRVMFSSALATFSVVRPIRTSASFGSFLVSRTFSASPLVQATREEILVENHHAAAKRWKALAPGMFKRVNIPLLYLANRTANTSNGKQRDDRLLRAHIGQRHTPQQDMERLLRLTLFAYEPCCALEQCCPSERCRKYDTLSAVSA